MAQLVDTFDPNSVDDSALGFEPIPGGEYLMQITESDAGPTKNGRGEMLKLVWEILDGDFANRKIFQNINYKHESVQAMQIGQGQLKQVCNAVGLGDHLQDTEQLHFVPCLVRVVVTPPKDGYSARNDVKGVKAYAAPQAANDNVKGAARPAANDNAPPAQQAAAQPRAAAAAQAPGGAKPAGSRPWRTA